MKLKAHYDVVLVSAFGRLEPLAIELSQRGMEVALLDVTKGFESLDFRDVSGPFPMVTPSPSLPAHTEWVTTQAAKELDRGLSVWLRSGPLELRGPLGTFYSDHFLPVGLLKDYLAKRLQGPKGLSGFGRAFRDLSFQENWLIHLSHGVTQVKMTMHCESAHLSPEPFPMNKSAHSIHITKESLNDLKGATINAGVDYVEEIPVDMDLNGRLIDNFVIPSGKIRAHFYVWGVPQEESFHFNSKLASRVFAKEKPKLSDWVWRRLVLKTSSELFERMPECFLMIQNPDWSWTNENFVIFRNEIQGEWDLWIRTPRSTEDVSMIAESIKGEIESRIGSDSFEISIPPSNGLFCFPVYEEVSLSSLPKPSHKNLIFEAQEGVGRLDWASRFESQPEVLSKLESWKIKLDKQMLKKGGVIDRSIHAP